MISDSYAAGFARRRNQCREEETVQSVTNKDGKGASCNAYSTSVAEVEYTAIQL